MPANGLETGFGAVACAVGFALLVAGLLTLWRLGNSAPAIAALAGGMLVLGAGTFLIARDQLGLRQLERERAEILRTGVQAQAEVVEVEVSVPRRGNPWILHARRVLDAYSDHHYRSEPLAVNPRPALGKTVPVGEATDPQVDAGETVKTMFFGVLCFTLGVGAAIAALVFEREAAREMLIRKHLETRGVAGTATVVDLYETPKATHWTLVARHPDAGYLAAFVTPREGAKPKRLASLPVKFDPENPRIYRLDTSAVTAGP